MSSITPTGLIVMLALVVPILGAMAVTAFVQAAITDRAAKNDYALGAFSGYQVAHLAGVCK